MIVSILLLLTGEAVGAMDPEGDCHGEALGVATLEGVRGHFANPRKFNPNT